MPFVRIDDVEQACQLRDAGLLWRFLPVCDPEYCHLTRQWLSKDIRRDWVGATTHGAYFCIQVEE